MTWLSSQEIADLAKAGELPGYPKTSRSIHRLAVRKNWRQSGLARRRKGRQGGGGWEYHSDLLHDGGKYDAAVQFLWAVTGNQTLHVRLIILGLAKRFQKASDQSNIRSEKQFCEIYNIGIAGFPTWIRRTTRTISPAVLARWRKIEREK